MELETTAATASIARKVEENAEHVHEAAHDAADKAKVSVSDFAPQVMAGTLCVLCSLEDGL